MENIHNKLIWPPPSLEANAEAIVNECELAEVTPFELPLLAPIHMAALIYLNELVHARHLWRRQGPSKSPMKTDDSSSTIASEASWFEDWWHVAKCMIQQPSSHVHNADEITTTTTATTSPNSFYYDENTEQALTKCIREHPEPLRTYALEIISRPRNKPQIQSLELNQQVITFLETRRWNM